MTDEVKFTDAQWDELARAAEAFAGVLDQEGGRLRDVMAINWAGSCSEGVGIVDNLRLLLYGEGPSSFKGAINSEALYLRQLAVQCRGAGTALAVSDSDSEQRFRDAT